MAKVTLVEGPSNRIITSFGRRWPSAKGQMGIPDYWSTRQALLDNAGIGIPLPQMDVHVDGKLGGAWS